MKHLKSLVLAALAVAALTALGGAASAQAHSTSLCMVKTNPCPAASQYPNKTKLAAKTVGKMGEAGWKPALLTTEKLGNVECSLTVAGETTNGPTATPTLEGTINELNFSECTLGGNACTVTAVHLPYKGAFTPDAAIDGNGTLTASTDGNGDPGATVVCGAVINCTYTNADPIFQAFGGEAGKAQIVAEKIKLARSTETGKCPIATFDGTAVVEEPTAFPIWLEP